MTRAILVGLCLIVACPAWAQSEATIERWRVADLKRIDDVYEGCVRRKQVTEKTCVRLLNQDMAAHTRRFGP